MARSARLLASGSALAGLAVGYSVDYGPHEGGIPAAPRHPSVSRASPLEQANPAYRYGWESHDRPEFHDKTYDHIRPELQKGWTGSGDFADFEPYIKHAWERRAVVMQDGTEAERPVRSGGQ